MLHNGPVAGQEHPAAGSGAPVPFHVPPGGGHVLDGPVGGPLRILADGERTGGWVTACVNEVAPGMGPPLHRHRHEDEMYYVLAGRLRFRAGDELFDAPSGSFVFVPRGTPHTFRNPGDVVARTVLLFTPAGMENFFRGLAAEPAGPVPAQVYERIAEGSGMEVLGPPMNAGE